MRYNTRNRRKYSLKVHLIFVTKYRKMILNGTIADDVKQKFFDLAKSHGWEILAMETDKDHIHLLLCYDCTERVCDIVRVLKQDSTHMLWQKYRNALNHCYKFAAKNPQACLWDESRFLLDNNIEKIYNLCIIQNNERLVLAMYECPKDCLSCANSFSEPAVNDNEPDVLHCMEKDGQIVEETDCCDKYN